MRMLGMVWDFVAVLPRASAAAARSMHVLARSSAYHTTLK
jgi:hypothetical protein